MVIAWLVGPLPSGKCPPGNSTPSWTCQMTSTLWPGASYRPKKKIGTSRTRAISEYTERSMPTTSSGRASARLTERRVAIRASTRSDLSISTRSGDQMAYLQYRRH